MRSITTKTDESLVLVRTPFQAWLVEKVMEAEKVTAYDLLYFTQNNSPEDRFYYRRLAANARSAKFVFVPRQARDLLNHVLFASRAWPFVFRNRYNSTIISSIDAYALNAVATRSAAGKLVTFDDGTANYNQAGIYFNESSSIRGSLYRYLFRAKSITATREKIVRHYTIQPEFQNIVDNGRLRAIVGWGKSTKRQDESTHPKTYFIGAPFHEVFDQRQIDILEAHAKMIGVDVYVRHPRELETLNLVVPLLDKHGKIAEEAILDDAAGRPIVLIGFLSSVMFNLAACAHRRIILVPSGSERHSALSELAYKSGCELVQIPGLKC